MADKIPSFDEWEAEQAVAPTAPAAVTAPAIPSFEEWEAAQAPTRGATESLVLEEAKKAGLEGKELAAFMAQTAHESNNFQAMSEYGPGKASYSGGTRYKGRGPLQLTHDYNYKKYGDRIGLDLVNNPELVEDPAIGVRVALEYWKDNVRPKVKDWDNVFEHSKAINAPFAKVETQVNGMEDRKAKYTKYAAELITAEEPKVQAMRLPKKVEEKAEDVFDVFRTRKDVIELQKDLRKYVNPKERELLDKKAVEGTPNLPPEEVRQTRVLPSEVVAIARKYDVDPEALKTLAPFYGAPMAAEGYLANIKQLPAKVLGTAGEALLGLPQKLSIEAQNLLGNPQMREALDDLRTLGQGKKSLAEMGVDLATGVLAGGDIAGKAAQLAAPAGKIAAKAAGAAAIAAEGAVGGAAQAESGKEVMGAFQGMLFSTGLAGALKTLGLGGKAVSAGVNKLNELRTRTSRQLQEAAPKFFEEAAVEAQQKYSGGRSILNTAVISNASLKGEDLKDATALANKLGQENVDALYEFAKQTRPDKVRRIEQELVQNAEDLKVKIDNVKTEIDFTKLGQESLDWLNAEKKMRVDRLAEGVTPRIAEALTQDISELDDLIRKTKAGPERIAKLEETLKNLNVKLEKTTIDPKAAVARSTVENFVRGFASDILGTRLAYRQQDPLAALRVYTKDPEKLNAAMEQYFFKQHARQKIRAENYRAMPEAAKNLKRIGDVVQASRYTAEAIDRTHGTKVQLIIDGMGRLYNDLHSYIRPRAEEVSGLIQQTKAANITTEDLYDALRKGEGLDNETVQGWRRFFDSALEDAKTLGVDIQARKNYVPVKMKPADELTAVLTQRAQELKAEGILDLQNVVPTKEQVAELVKNPKVKELFDSLDILQPGKEDYTAKLLSTLNDARSGAINKVIAARGLKRAEETTLPDLILDKDVGRLAQSWIESTFKSGVMRQSISELRDYAELMKKVGDKNANRYLQNLVADVTGMPRDGGLGKELSTLKSKYAAYMQEKALTATNPLEKTLYSTATSLSDMAPLLHKTMYANTLGFGVGVSARQIVTNMASIATMTIPELGYMQGGKLVAKSMIRVANDLIKGREITIRSPEVAKALKKNVGDVEKTRKLSLILQNDGLASSQWNENLERSFTNSLKKSGFQNVTDKSFNAYSKLMLFAFEASENIMRAMTKDIGSELAKLHGKGDKDYQTFLDTLPRAYRKAIDGAKDDATRERLLTDYVVSKTVFNYNQASASEAARSVGPILSSYTRWPTEIAGDTINTFAKNGVTAGMADFTYRRLAPLMGVLFLGGILATQEQDKDSPLYYFVRQNNLAYLSPLNSLAGIFEGDVAPPALSIPAQMGKAVVTADPATAAKATHDTLKLFIPGGGLISSLIKDYSDEKTK